MRTHLALPLTLLLATALPSATLAQPLRQLGAPTATFDEPFTVVSGLRELADGRVLVSDSRDRTVQVVDLRSGDARAVGREGAGPGEFGMPTRLYAMPGDSTLMSDFANGRFLIFLPNGNPGPTFRIPESSPAFFGGLVGVDPQGRLVFTREKVTTAEGQLSSTSGVVYVLRYDRRTERADTLGTLAEPVGEQSGARALPGGMLQMYTNLPFAARDLAVVTTRGDVIIVRASPYRLDRVGADGRMVTGSPAAASRVRVTQAEREAFVRSQVRPGSITVRGSANSAPVASGGARAATPVFSGDVEKLFSPDMTWPDVKPPFSSGGAFAASDGSVWVLRSRAHDDKVPVFDVFDAAGQVKMRVALPAATRLVGFGRGALYLVRTDADDLQYLEKYALPAMP